ncbi:EthD family reductase [Kribbella italica]|uniref:Uncharacterized protein (TIGR02118 family) n=1 Tax=Kribbella italica TaxID=1540520 RepID=A0A7W9J5N6_9ACTN|nr:EthD family reductase [Kribbella italica]MBB5835850.1 uncharacterized protein (TIGR02118 family) [Kribbella italica]
MTARLVIAYGHPDDTAAFEDYYTNTHIPYAGEHMPGVRDFQNSRVTATVDGGRPPYYRISHLTYDDLPALHEAIGSEGGRSTIADLDNFATGGVTLLIVEDD